MSEMLRYMVIVLLTYESFLHLVHGHCCCDHDDNEQIIGPPGRPGKAGIKGSQGNAGEPGRDGRNGIVGGKGVKGEPGICDCSESTTSQKRMAYDLSMNRDWTWIFHGSNIYGFKLFKEAKTYQQAMAACEAVRATLACVGMRVPAVRERVKAEVLRSSGSSRVWIGLDDLERMNHYVWLDGVVSNRENTDWSPNQPSSPAERCVELRYFHDQMLNDVSCSMTFHYVCEKFY